MTRYRTFFPYDPNPVISYIDGVINGGLVEFLLSISGVVCVGGLVIDDVSGGQIVMVRVDGGSILC